MHQFDLGGQGGDRQSHRRTLPAAAGRCRQDNQQPNVGLRDSGPAKRRLKRLVRSLRSRSRADV